ncbi:MAG TPA: type IV pilin, partial [Candidatus Nanoarchaeia archaeon]|nr:type IV pilin [Candidatus Nanoarchaeia archaeon]
MKEKPVKQAWTRCCKLQQKKRAEGMGNNYFIQAAWAKKEKSKKAVSEIIATILIVLFVIVALIIISVFLFQYMKRQSQDITSQCLDTRTSITKAEFNSTLNITTLYLKRTAGDSVI